MLTDTAVYRSAHPIMFTEIPSSPPATPLLDNVPLPSEVRRLNPSQLPQLANELRAFLLYSVGQTGGHFGAGLGVIELTIALHYVFNTPDDDLIWDVGHQCYPHKILTGRRKQMATMRQLDGLAPFPAREESSYDSFGVGHSSTSISAALGIALAKQKQARANSKKATSKTVAIIGDGALTAGMAFEALNHAAHCQTPMLIILNDNTMSISANTGGLASYLARIFHKPTKNDTDAPSVQSRNFFQDLGLHFSGSINGHDIHALTDAFKNAFEIANTKQTPCILHVRTQKGYGYTPALNDPIGYHALTKIEKKNTSTPQEKHGGIDAQDKANSTNEKTQRKYQDLFGQWLCDLAEHDSRTLAITPAMREGSGLVEFSQRFPDRFFDVAIAEQHAVTLAAGLASAGLKPVVAIYSTFLQRAYDQLIHDVAIQKLDVLFAIDRAGIVGGDGATHNGAFDIAFLRCIPKLIIAAPSTEIECERLLHTAYQYSGPAAVRYPRGAAHTHIEELKSNTKPGIHDEKNKELSVGKARHILHGKNLCILSFGALLSEAFNVAQSHNFGLVDMRWIKPLDEDCIKELSNRYSYFVTLEESCVAGGAGSVVLEFLAKQTYLIPTLQLGLPDDFVQHGSRQSLLQRLKLDQAGIEQSILDWLAN